MDATKIENLVAPALLLFGGGSWSRMAIQGIEQGMLSAATEWLCGASRRWQKFLPKREIERSSDE